MLKIVRAGNFRLNFVISYNVLYWKFVTMGLIIGVKNCVRNVENSLQQFSKLFFPNCCQKVLFAKKAIQMIVYSQGL